MNFVKRGLIFNPNKVSDWQDNTFITPEPYLLNDHIIRIFGGFRDSEGKSRIGYIDVASDNPSQVVGISSQPILELGQPGTFDDNGIILGSVINVDSEIRMYYVGFQLVKQVKFLAFSGLAISKDGGNTFSRIQETPVLDRYKDEKYIRAIHTVIWEDGRYRIWYSQGDGWQIINGIPYPRYTIMYTESLDGIHIPDEPRIPCIDIRGEEYRIGRPTVFKEDGIYKMFYTRDTLQKIYHVGYAESVDGINWVRKDELFSLKTSAAGWDSEMICYPVPIRVRDKHYVFYSGNGMGATGVGYAEYLQ